MGTEMSDVIPLLAVERVRACVQASFKKKRSYGRKKKRKEKKKKSV